MKKLSILVTFLLISFQTHYIFGQDCTAYGKATSSRGYRNSVFGVNAGKDFNNDSKQNCYFGAFTGEKTNSGKYNSFFGQAAGYKNTSGTGNSFVGQAAGYNNTTGNYNTFMGQGSGVDNTTGTNNSFFGYYSGSNNTTGGRNSFFGRQSGNNNTTGNNNTFIGYQTGYYNTTGTENAFSGYLAGHKNTEGNRNTFLGRGAGYDNTKGSYNTYVGWEAGSNSEATATGNVFLGYSAGRYSSGSNKLYIANSSTSSPLIYGEFDNKILKINGRTFITGSNGLFFSQSATHTDGLPQARMRESWGIRYDAPVSKWVFSSKNSVLVGYQPNGTDYGNGSLFVQRSLGVGTTSPSKIFEVNTGVKTHDDAIVRIIGSHNPGLELYSKTNWHPRVLLTTNDGKDKWEMSAAGSWGNRGLVFSYNNNNHLTISKDGNIGIGKTNPGYKLDVAGVVKANSFISSTASFPDYVFEKDYDIMPLNKLELFVDEHKHLPNMPSEKEVIENGMDISKVTIKSVENIETIYLHLIELSKKVEALEQENAELKKHMNL